MIFDALITYGDNRQRVIVELTDGGDTPSYTRFEVWDNGGQGTGLPVTGDDHAISLLHAMRELADLVDGWVDAGKPLDNETPFSKSVKRRLAAQGKMEVT